MVVIINIKLGYGLVVVIITIGQYPKEHTLKAVGIFQCSICGVMQTSTCNCQGKEFPRECKAG